MWQHNKRFFYVPDGTVFYDSKPEGRRNKKPARDISPMIRGKMINPVRIESRSIPFKDLTTRLKRV
jgi:hypothetical protein